MPDTITTIDLLRHGEAEGGSCYRGHQDDPLSETGWQQMQQVLGGQHPWDVIITSPLLRCQAFARSLAERYDITLIEDSDLQEIGFGEWEGKSSDELLAHDADALYRFWQNPMLHPPPGGESVSEFEKRVLVSWQRLQDEYRNCHVLLVSHAGTMRMILRQVLDLPLESVFRLDIGHACLSRISIHNDKQNSISRLIFHASRLA